MFKVHSISISVYFLGIEVHRDADGMYLKQTKYIRDLINNFNMEKASCCPSPMETRKQFTTKGEVIANPTLYI